MEVWGGIECSINRVGESYFDQLEYNKLYDRPELLNHIVELGLKAMRFPILWEKNWPDHDKAPVWAVERQLKILKENNVNIIAGLLHHGSGPSFASIEDDNFAENFAIYAKLVAIKFPWINDYTPINEILTTARFCGLYGLWHPHYRESKGFLKILINQSRATILAMRAIREVNPNARLILTEDLTKIQGTKELKVQVDFENHRRWLSLDLLCGKVNSTHPLWHYLIEHGITDEQLLFFIENAISPNLLGFNYYVTSERYLDHKVDDHPTSTHGGNGQMCYADIEAVRHPVVAVAGLENLMREAWLRYKLPMAVTEAHLCCGREDQLRWLKYIWDTCAKLNTEGINIIAVTFWALFGAYGWDKLLTKKKGSYESGAFDLSTGIPRQTAIAKLITALGHGKTYQSPLISGRGWWERNNLPVRSLRPVLIIGGSGTLGSVLARICTERNIPNVAPESNQLDLDKPEQINRAILQYRPWAVIDASGYGNFNVLEQGVKNGIYIDNIGSINLAKISKNERIPLLCFSSGQEILAIYQSAIIICPNPVYEPGNMIVTKAATSHLIHVALNLLIDEEHGTWHIPVRKE